MLFQVCLLANVIWSEAVDFSTGFMKLFHLFHELSREQVVYERFREEVQIPESGNSRESGNRYCYWDITAFSIPRIEYIFLHPTVSPVRCSPVGDCNVNLKSIDWIDTSDLCMPRRAACQVAHLDLA